MKSLLFILAFLLTTTAGFSQRITRGDDGLDKKVLSVEVSGPELLTLEMVKELQLTEPQQQEVKALNEQRYLQLQQTAQATELQKIHLQNDKALTRILTSEQFRRFMELEGRQHATHLSELDNN